MSKDKSGKFILCLKKDDMVLKPSEVFDVLKEVGVDPTVRAEDLSLDDWIKLYEFIKNGLRK